MSASRIAFRLRRRTSERGFGVVLCDWNADCCDGSGRLVESSLSYVLLGRLKSVTLTMLMVEGFENFIFFSKFRSFDFDRNHSGRCDPFEVSDQDSLSDDLHIEVKATVFTP